MAFATSLQQLLRIAAATAYSWTLPAADAAGFLRSNGAGVLSLTEALSASNLLSGTIPDGRFPAGAVLQIVAATYATETSSASSTYSDTGLTAAITPRSATSKILVIVTQNGVYKDTADTGVGLKLQCEGVDVAPLSSGAGQTGAADVNHIGSVSGQILHAPATTAQRTYKTVFNSTANVARTRVQQGNVTSTMVLMEIKQ